MIIFNNKFMDNNKRILIMRVPRSEDQSKAKFNQVQQTRQLLKFNEKIKVAIILNKLQKYSELSDHLKNRINMSKVKRAQILRHRIYEPVKSVPGSRHKMHTKQHLLSIDTTINREDLETVVNNIENNKEIKQSDVQQVQNKKYYQSYKKLIKDRKALSKIRPTESLTLSIDSGYNHRKSTETAINTPDIPFFLKLPEKVEMRRYSTIDKQYEKSLENLDLVDDVSRNDRKYREKMFYNKIKDSKNYYRMISKINFSNQSYLYDQNVKQSLQFEGRQ